MKRKVTTCDICRKDITDARTKYKFKEYESNYVNMEDFEFTKWKRCDMCLSCFFDLLQFVKDKRKGGADNE